jgi:hypothetical protein
MPVTALSSTSRDVLVGDVWQLVFMVRDTDMSIMSGVTPTVVITLPDGTIGVAPPLDTDPMWSGGAYRFDYTLTVPGRHLATVDVAGYGRLVYVAWAKSATANTGLPTVDDVDDYLKSGGGDHSWTTDDMAGALDAEQAAQRRVCRVDPSYPADLREALLRRVQRNLALRPNALAMFRGDADAGDAQSPLPRYDPEVSRLERPYRKLPMG